MKTVAALLRVSTPNGQTVDPQRLQVEAWAAVNAPEGVTYYVEDGVSGASKARPVRDKMLAAVRAGKHHTIVCAALDRIGRRAAEVVLILDEMRTRGVRVVSLREGLDMLTTTGQMVASVLAFVAQLERDMISERTKAGLASRKAAGVRLGNRGFQYEPRHDALLLSWPGTSPHPRMLVKREQFVGGTWVVVEREPGFDACYKRRARLLRSQLSRISVDAIAVGT